jgi:hypothetical protein
MKIKHQALIKYLLAFALFFSAGFFSGTKFTQKKIAQKPSFDQDGFVKSVTKTITGKISEVKKDSLVLIKGNKTFTVELDPRAKITITKLTPVSASPSGEASPGAAFLPPPEIIREAPLSDLRVGDQTTITVTETPDGRLFGRVVSVQRR